MNDTTKVVLGVVVGVFALLLLVLLAGGGMFGMGPMMNGFGDGPGGSPGGSPGGMMGGWFGSWWMLVPILFWAGLLAVIVWAVARIFLGNRSGGDGPGRDAAEEVLRERFARGEMDAEEYERSLETLRGSRTRGNERSNTR
jgi:putative membrane protein